MLKGLKGLLKASEKVTYEGGKAYEQTLRETVAEVFSLGLIRGNFYQSDLEVIENTKELMTEALEKYPEWATKCAIYGQRFNSLKLVPAVWLVYLSTLKNKSLFEKAFKKIINNPKMLHDFLELTRKGGIRQGMGRSVKRVTNEWLNDRLNDYHATRYKGKLAQIIKTARPAANERIQPFMDYIINGNEEAFARAAALKTVINTLTEGRLDENTLALIKEYELQLEELKHTFGKLIDEQKQAIFEFMIPGLKYNALVSNLVTIERVFATETRKVGKRGEHGAFSQSEVVSADIPKELVEIVATKLSDFEAYRKSKMLPFGLITAQGMTKTPEWQAAIDTVLQKSGKDVFAVPENVGVRIGVDTSGSMTTRVTPKLTACDIASLFGAMVYMSITHAAVYATATFTKKVKLNANKSLFENAREIAETDVGYGTRFEPLLDGYKGEKFVLLITDGQQSDNIESKWAKLRGRPEGSKLVIWHVAGYNNKISDRNDVVYLKGFSDRLLGVLKNIIEDKAGQIAEIEAVEI